MGKRQLRGKYLGIVKGAVTRSVIVCPDCGEAYPVYRKIKKNRSYQAGHIKDLYCYVCKDEKKMIQLSADEAKYNF